MYVYIYIYVCIYIYTILHKARGFQGGDCELVQDMIGKQFLNV